MNTNGTKRGCDGCTLCCFTHGITIDGFLTFKKAFQWCKECTEGQGCAVYVNGRPSVCEGFLCAWLEGLGSEEDRPDKTGVVPEWRNTRFGRTLVIFGRTDEALKTPYAKELVARYVSRGAPVACFSPNEKRILLREGAIVEESLLRKTEEEKIEIEYIS